MHINFTGIQYLNLWELIKHFTWNIMQLLQRLVHQSHLHLCRNGISQWLIAAWLCSMYAKIQASGKPSWKSDSWLVFSYRIGLENGLKSCVITSYYLLCQRTMIRLCCRVLDLRMWQLKSWISYYYWIKIGNNCIYWYTMCEGTLRLANYNSWSHQVDWKGF